MPDVSMSLKASVVIMVRAGEHLSDAQEENPDESDGQAPG